MLVKPRNEMDDDLINLFEKVNSLKNMQSLRFLFCLLLENKQQFKFKVVTSGHLTLFSAFFFVILVMF